MGRRSRNLLVGGGVVLGLVSQAGLADMYRWVDEQGRVHYSDSPPVTSKGSTSQLSKQGMVVRKIEGEMSASERAQRDKEKAQQDAAQRAQEEQKLHDKALLSTFNNTAEIDRKRDRSIEQVQGEINNLKTRLKATEARLSAYTQQAGSFTTANKPVPDDLKKDTADTEAEMLAIRKQVEGREKQKAVIMQQAEADTQRFLELTQGKKPGG